MNTHANASTKVSTNASTNASTSKDETAEVSETVEVISGSYFADATSDILNYEEPILKGVFETTISRSSILEPRDGGDVYRGIFNVTVLNEEGVKQEIPFFFNIGFANKLSKFDIEKLKTLLTYFDCTLQELVDNMLANAYNGNTLYLGLGSYIGKDGVERQTVNRVYTEVEYAEII